MFLALDLIMKHILMQRGIKIVDEKEKTHNLKRLLNILYSNGFDFNEATTLRINADEISTWNTGSRYGKGVFSTKEMFDTASRIYDDICDCYLNNKPVVSLDITGILRDYKVRYNIIDMPGELSRLQSLYNTNDISLLAKYIKKDFLN
ncbi:MAG: HEPN domain-containing protein [Lachnospiraceae bacterium]|nr:HEPN domain-containing protein [Lachnospiraceae bacterium]MCM1235617.1 HEPN domain-containing protein [Ruminococcus flavefaciens]